MGDYDDMILAARILWDEWRIRPTGGFRVVDLHEVTSVLVQAQYGDESDDWFVPQSEVLRIGHPDAVRRVAAAQVLGAPRATGLSLDAALDAVPPALREQIVATVERFRRDDATVVSATIRIFRERVARCRYGTVVDDVWVALDSERVISFRHDDDAPPPRPVSTWPWALHLPIGAFLYWTMGPAARNPTHGLIWAVILSAWVLAGLLLLVAQLRQPASRPAADSAQPARPPGR